MYSKLIFIIATLLCTHNGSYSRKSNKGTSNNQYGKPFPSIVSSSSSSSSNPSVDPQHYPLPWQIKIIQKGLALLNRNQPSSPSSSSQLSDNLKSHNNHKNRYYLRRNGNGSNKLESSLSSSIYNEPSSLAKWNNINIKAFQNVVDHCKRYFKLVSLHFHSLFHIHKKSVIFLLKSFGLTFLTIWIINRIINWYKGIAETEILLDKTDYIYHSYGYNLNGIGNWLISNFNQTTIQKHNYRNIIKHLENVLDAPCFPRTMNVYASQTGKDILPILNELQTRIKESSSSGSSIAGIAVATDHNDVDVATNNGASGIFGDTNSNNSTLTNTTTATVPVMDVYEQRLIKGIQKGLLLAQARQTDAILRLTRTQILTSINTCEDLLVYWKARVMKKTQNFRLPLPRVVLSHIPGLGRRFRSNALQSVQFALSNLNIGGSPFIRTVTTTTSATTPTVPLQQQQSKASSIVNSPPTASVNIIPANIVVTNDDHTHTQTDTHHVSVPVSNSTESSSISSSSGGSGSGDDTEYTSMQHINSTKTNNNQNTSSSRSNSSILWNYFNWNPFSRNKNNKTIESKKTQLQRDKDLVDLYFVVNGSRNNNNNNNNNNSIISSNSSSRSRSKSMLIRLKNSLGFTTVKQSDTGIISELTFDIPLQHDNTTHDTNQTIINDTCTNDLNNITGTHVTLNGTQTHNTTVVDTESNTHHHHTIAKSEAEPTPSSSSSSAEYGYEDSYTNVTPPSEVDVDSLLKSLNAREKVLFLEEVQEELYELAGRVQRHLDALETTGSRLMNAVKLKSSTTTNTAVASTTTTAGTSTTTAGGNSGTATVAVVLPHTFVLPTIVSGSASTQKDINVDDDDDDDDDIMSSNKSDNIDATSKKEDESKIRSHNHPSHTILPYPFATHASSSSSHTQPNSPQQPQQAAQSTMDNTVSTTTSTKVSYPSKTSSPSSLPLPVSSSTTTNQLLSLTPLMPHSAWEELELWIHDAAILCSESLNLISLDKDKQQSSLNQLSAVSLNMNNINNINSINNVNNSIATYIDDGVEGRKLNMTTYINTTVYQPTYSSTTAAAAHDTDATITSDSAPATATHSLFSSFYHKPTIKTNNNSNQIIHSNNNATTTILYNNILKIRNQYYISSILIRDLNRAPTLFESHLDSSGLKIKSKSHRTLFALKQVRRLIKLGLWGGVLMGVIEVTKWSEDIAIWSNIVIKNFQDFVSRRITTPTVSIVNDVIFNNRVSLSDKSALNDAMRSLQAMLFDFLKEYRPKMSDAERKRIVQNMDMTPISMEYENELKRPIQNLVSGRIARLVLIQLQFVKKELLMAMQAIDELFNANQVNMQLLAVTPAFLSIAFMQVVIKTTLSTIRSSSKGRFIESTWAVHRDLRVGLRQLEKLLSISDAYNSPSFDTMSMSERGKLMSILYRLQNVLVMHSSRFEDVSLRLLQEDLREISTSRLSVSQRLALVERIERSYSFFQPTRKLWPTGGL